MFFSMCLRTSSTSLQQLHFTLRRSPHVIKTMMRKQYLNCSFRTFSKSAAVTHVQSMSEVKEKLHKILGSQRGFSHDPVDRTSLLKLLPESQNDLPERKMNDSFDQALIPLSTDLGLQDKYSTIKGFVRRGRLMEDMDIFAVWCAFKHILNPKDDPNKPSPYVLVTALVDQMSFTPVVPLPDADIRLSGHVSWVGTSSLEVTVWLEQQQDNQWKRLTRSIFLMAARNSINTGAAAVNKLVASSPHEEAIIKGGFARKEYRSKLQLSNLLKMEPDETEQKIIHKLFVDTVDKDDKTFEKRTLPPHSMWMDDTRMATYLSSHPENRNMHNTVFGGFLMRQAMELSYSCCFRHCKVRPELIYIGDIAFHRPIQVGSIIKMIARVIYTDEEHAQLSTYAEVHDIFHRTVETTNEFHFTYRVPLKPKRVYPTSYNEAMMYLNGRRHFGAAMSYSEAGSVAELLWFKEVTAS